MEITRVTKEAIVDEMLTWRGKGHHPLLAIQFLTIGDGVSMGIQSYTDHEVILVSEDMDRPYQNHAQAFAALGALFDEMAKHI